MIEICSIISAGVKKLPYIIDLNSSTKSPPLVQARQLNIDSGKRDGSISCSLRADKLDWDDN